MDGVDLEPFPIGTNALRGIHRRTGREGVTTGAHAAVPDGEILKVRLGAKGSTGTKLHAVMGIAVPRKDGLAIVVGHKTTLRFERVCRASLALDSRRQA